MQLDPAKSYLLSRPRGGFNDAMVQLEKSCRYAEKFGRVLLLDMSRSGLRMQIDELFDLQGGPGRNVVLWHDDMAPELDRAASVFPDALCHRISTYETVWQQDAIGFADSESGQLISFDHTCDHDAQVLVYEQAGGGYTSLNALRRLGPLRADVAAEIVARLVPLGRGYDAVHLRHSDYETDFVSYLRELRPVLRGRRVLICSDSRAAKDAAADILHNSTTVLSVSDIPDLGGQPLHRTAYGDDRAANIDVLCDLLAMALADTLFFTRLSGGNDNGVKYSGFSLLADLLGRNRDVVGQLLANADPKARETILARSPARGLIHRLRCGLHVWRHPRAYAKRVRRNRRANRATAQP